jgi:hypothetical protein
MAKLLTFVETDVFRKRLDEFASLEALFRIQAELLENPIREDVIPGTNGLRKGRIGDIERGRGKRGGFRYLYLYLAHAGIIYLIYVFPKTEKANLSETEKREFSQFVALIRKNHRN